MRIARIGTWVRLRSTAPSLAIGHSVLVAWSGREAFISDVEAIELAFVAQWAHFGQGPSGSFHRDGDLTWIEAPVPELPYNAVVRSQLRDDAEARIDEVIRSFQKCNVQFMWLVHPTAQPTDLARLLALRDLRLVEQSTGMSLDLTRWHPSGHGIGDGVTFEEVTTESQMAAYEELIARYWELGDASCDYVFGINRWAAGLGHGVRFVAFKDGAPVGKAYLSWTLGDDAHALSDATASIYGVFVDPSARGLGIAATLMDLLLDRAAASGRRRVVLHSSAMAIELYLRLGFAARCVLPVFATTSLHSLQPS